MTVHWPNVALHVARNSMVQAARQLMQHVAVQIKMMPGPRMMLQVLTGTPFLFLDERGTTQ